MRAISIFIFGVVTLIALIYVGRPVYWRYKAEHLRPFRDPSFATQGEAAAGNPYPSPPAPEPEKPAAPVDPRVALTWERAQALAQDGYLVVTWANHFYLDFVITWVHHAQAAGITGYLVGAMDDKLQEELLKRGINTFGMSSGLTTQDLGWGSKDFAKMGRNKIRLVPMFLRLGVDVVLSDVDVAWLRNPLPFFQRFPEADILSSSDHLSPTVTEEALERFPDASFSAANIGIMLFRNNSLPFVKEWITVIEADDTIWDQNAFNDLFKRNVRALENNTNNVFLADSGQLRMGILPISTFMSGHTFFVQRLHKRLALQPYAVHATYQFSGTAGKRHRFREALLWKDAPEYFSHSVGFLTFKNPLKGSLLSTAGPRTGQKDLANVVGHFEIAKVQIRRVRMAAAVAQMLGRALIMPDLWCGLDRYWAPHSGTIPGSKFKLPFKCPMDHVFDLESGWCRALDAGQFGPPIEFREHSFLRNPEVPQEVHQSRVTVHICAPGTVNCSDGSSPAPLLGALVKVQAGLTSDRLKVALANVEDSKLLAFSSMEGVWGGHSDAQEGARFHERMKLYGSLWCCVDAHPGHVHYDLLWDLPHTDRFNREWTEWNVTTGP